MFEEQKVAFNECNNTGLYNLSALSHYLVEMGANLYKQANCDWPVFHPLEGILFYLLKISQNPSEPYMLNRTQLNFLLLQVKSSAKCLDIFKGNYSNEQWGDRPWKIYK